jgi:hypothetical protein
MRSPFDTDLWRHIYARHRRKLFVAQAVAFVLIGIAIAGMLWRSPRAPTARDVETSDTPVTVEPFLFGKVMSPTHRLTTFSLVTGVLWCRFHP